MHRLFGRLGVAGGSRRLLMSGGDCMFPVRSGTMRLVQLFGAIRTFKVVSLTGNGESGDGHKQDGE